MRTLFSTTQWITWFIATVTAVGSVVSYAHSTFITIREADQRERRLDRIEEKIDQLMSANGINIRRQEYKQGK